MWSMAKVSLNTTAHVSTEALFPCYWRLLSLFSRSNSTHENTCDIFNWLKGEGPLCICAGVFIIFNEFSHDIASTAWARRISSKNKFHSSMFKARAVFCWAWIAYPTLVLSLLPPPVNRCYNEPLILFCIKQLLIMVRQQWMNFNSSTSAYILCLLAMLISDIRF